MRRRRQRLTFTPLSASSVPKPGAHGAWQYADDVLCVQVHIHTQHSRTKPRLIALRVVLIFVFLVVAVRLQRALILYPGTFSINYDYSSLAIVVVVALVRLVRGAYHYTAHTCVRTFICARACRANTVPGGRHKTSPHRRKLRDVRDNSVCY